MMELLFDIGRTLLATCRDVVPILSLVAVFQLLVLKQPIANLARLIVGVVYVIIGLTLFLVGLEKALFPIGTIMAQQLSSAPFIHGTEQFINTVHWTDFGWVYLFAFLIGFSTTIAEPSLLAVAIKANEVSGGTISQWGLRLTVALGVAIGISLGVFRIITGMPLYLFILSGYLIVTVQTFFAPKDIIPLAYDSGGVTTSTVTVPVVAALGVGLAGSIPGRNPAIDGFGLIAFASLFPIIAVLAYAQYVHWYSLWVLKK